MKILKTLTLAAALAASCAQAQTTPAPVTPANNGGQPTAPAVNPGDAKAAPGAAAQAAPQGATADGPSKKAATKKKRKAKDRKRAKKTK